MTRWLAVPHAAAHRRRQVPGRPSAVLAFSTSPLRQIARYRTGQQPNTVAVAPGGLALYVTRTGPGTVQLITR